MVVLSAGYFTCKMSSDWWKLCSVRQESKRRRQKPGPLLFLQFVLLLAECRQLDGMEVSHLLTNGRCSRVNSTTNGILGKSNRCGNDLTTRAQATRRGFVIYLHWPINRLQTPFPIKVTCSFVLSFFADILCLFMRNNISS